MPEGHQKRTYDRISRITVITAVLIAAQFSLHAQEINLDSLKLVWNDASQPDSSRLQSIQLIANEGLSNNQDSALYYARLQYDFAKQVNLSEFMSRSLEIQASVYRRKGIYEQAIDFHLESLGLKREVGNKPGMVSSLMNIGAIYYSRGDFEQSVKYYTEALKMAEEIDDKEGMFKSLSRIGNVYNALLDYDQAIEYHTQSLRIIEELGDKRAMAITFNNLGLAYYHLEDYPKALEYHNRSLTIKEEIGYRNGVRLSLSNIAEVYRFQGDYLKALEYQNKSLELARELGRGVAMSINRIGFIYEDMKNYSKAIDYCEQALRMGQEVGSLFIIEAAANSLSKSYRYTDDHKKALDMYKLYISTRDSIDDIDGQREIIRQEFKYMYEKQAIADSVAFARQRELNSVREANKRYLLLGGFLFALVFIGIYFRIRTIKRNAEKEALLQEIRLMKIEGVIKTASNEVVKEQLVLDKEKIEEAINNTLNPSDWSILQSLFNNPAIGNNEIADQVALSVAGVRSSLQKMYRFFRIDKSANQRMILVMEATKISNNSFSEK